MLPLLVSFFLGFVPMFFFAAFIYWLDRYEKEPLFLLGPAFFWGVVVAAGGAFLINTTLGIGIYIFTGSEAASDFGTTSIIAPLTEEFLKGLAVLFVFLMFRKEFDSILDGIIYSAIVALGFAAAENTYYIYDLGFNESGWEGLWSLAVIRIIFVGWQHPFYTSFTGIGFALSRLNRNIALKIFAPILGFSAAVLTHAFHNTLGSMIGGFEGLAIGTLVDWSGWLIMFIFVLFMIYHERGLVIKHLREEVESGLITNSNYIRAISPITMSTSILANRSTRRFFQVCAELAHKKEQYNKIGNEAGNLAIIESLRRELSTLRPSVK